MNRSSHFDYSSVAERLKKESETQRKRQLHAERLRLAQSGAPRRRRPAPPRRPSLASRLMGALRDESKQMAAASLVLVGFAAWICSFAVGIYHQHTEAALASACRNKNYAYAGDVYCYDKRLVVHVLKEDGGATKPGLDWRVNERALRMAESQARVAEHEAQQQAQYAE